MGWQVSRSWGHWASNDSRMLIRSLQARAFCTQSPVSRKGMKSRCRSYGKLSRSSANPAPTTPFRVGACSANMIRSLCSWAEGLSLCGIRNRSALHFHNFPLVLDGADSWTRRALASKFFPHPLMFCRYFRCPASEQGGSWMLILLARASDYPSLLLYPICEDADPSLKWRERTANAAAATRIGCRCRGIGHTKQLIGGVPPSATFHQLRFVSLTGGVAAE